MRMIFIPGNGGGSPQDNWFPWLKREAEQRGIEVVDREFPDNQLARASYWLPFLEQELQADEETILVGHSSGAIAAMRYAEQHKILGSLLVGAYHTHLGMESEKKSEYFDAPWDWDSIRTHQQWIILFASTDDPWIPIEEARHLQTVLRPDYYEYTDQGHFGGDYHKESFPELLQAFERRCPGLCNGK